MQTLRKPAANAGTIFLADGGDVLKFVPASGAASRMFKALFAFVNGTEGKARRRLASGSAHRENCRFRLL